MGKIRKLSESGIYHVYCRGNSRRVIFYDDDDRLLFCNCVNNAAQKYDVKIYAYVLMDNHFHLLIKSKNLSKFVAGLKISFVKRYNKKHYLTDSLYGSRFGSSIKETSSAIRKSVLYILCNPVKAGVCKDIREYRWSSFNYSKSEINLDNSLVKFYFDSNDELRSEVNNNQQIKESEIVEKDDYWYKTSFLELNRILKKMLDGRHLSLLTQEELFMLKNELIMQTNATYFQIASLLNVNYKFVLKNRPKR
ncbi:MAG: transposase [Bacteroidales bacterium]